MGIKSKRVNADRDVNELASRFVKNEAWVENDATTYISEGKIVAVTGVSGGFVTVSKADGNGAAKTRTQLWITKAELRDYGEVTRWAQVTFDTSLGAIGDLVYLSDTAGDLSLSAGTNALVVGKVLSVGTSGVIQVDTGSPVAAEGQSLDLNGVGSLILDADADTKIAATTDDQIDVTINGAIDFVLTANTLTAVSGSTIATNTLAETTAASGVTVDGCLIKDGRAAALAVSGAYFVSSEQTGTGSSQNVAHGLGSTPTAVLISVTELPDAAAETGFDVAEGAHDATNVVVTVTNTVKFKVLAFK